VKFSDESIKKVESHPKFNIRTHRRSIISEW